MKNYLFAALLFAFTSSFIESDTKLIGRWKGSDTKNKTGEIVFEEGGYAYFIIDGQKLGGKDFMMAEQKAYMVYETNTGSKPFEIDFVIKSKETDEEVKRLPGIYIFLDKNRMKLRMNFGSSIRPKNFEPKSSSEILILKRLSN